jgi:hypothetical protein
MGVTWKKSIRPLASGKMLAFYGLRRLAKLVPPLVVDTIGSTGQGSVPMCSTSFGLMGHQSLFSAQTQIDPEDNYLSAFATGSPVHYTPTADVTAVDYGMRITSDISGTNSE